MLAPPAMEQNKHQGLKLVDEAGKTIPKCENGRQKVPGSIGSQQLATSRQFTEVGTVHARSEVQSYISPSDRGQERSYVGALGRVLVAPRCEADA